MIARRHRHQTGTIWLKSGSWYLRFYTDVGGERKQVARFLARKDDAHHSKTCKPVRDLAAMMIANENSASVVATEKVQTLKEFWEGTYEPYVNESKRLSTRTSYMDLWARHVEPVLGAAALTAIRTRSARLARGRSRPRSARHSALHRHQR